MSKEKDVKVSVLTVADLIPDDLNFNKGTEYGNALLEKSFQELGAGRSVLLDKNYRIIAGNKATEKYGAIGGEKVIVVDTTGDTLVAVRRTDVDLDSQRGRALALADNTTQRADFALDAEALRLAQEKWELPTADWGVPDWEEEPIDEETFGDKNKEIELGEDADEMELKLKFKFDEYQFVIEALAAVDGNKEQALLKLLNYGE